MSEDKDRDWRSHLWYFVSSFTEVDAKKLYKFYKFYLHAVKKHMGGGKEKERSTEMGERNDESKNKEKHHITKHSQKEKDGYKDKEGRKPQNGDAYRVSHDPHFERKERVSPARLSDSDNEYRASVELAGASYNRGGYGEGGVGLGGYRERGYKDRGWGEGGHKDRWEGGGGGNEDHWRDRPERIAPPDPERGYYTEGGRDSYDNSRDKYEGGGGRDKEGFSLAERDSYMGKPHKHHIVDMPGEPEAMCGEYVKCTDMMSYCKLDVLEVGKAASIKKGPDLVELESKTGLDGYTASMALSDACQVGFVLSLFISITLYPYVGLNEHSLRAQGCRH